MIAPASGRPLVVIVPGLGVRRYLAGVAAAHARAGADVLLLPGPGSRHVPRDVAAFGAEVATRVRALTRGQEERPVVILGHSTGAQVAALAAQELADLRVRLVLAGPTFDRRFGSLAEAAAAFLALVPRTRLDVLRILLPEWWAAGPAALVQASRSAWAHPLEAALAQLDGARADASGLMNDGAASSAGIVVTLVRGNRDTFAGAAWCRSLAALNGDQLLQLPSRDHTWPFDHEDECLAVTGVSRVDPRRSGRDDSRQLV